MSIKLVDEIRRSIGLMQAVAVLVASIIIGLTLSAVQLVHSFNQQRVAAMQLSDEILTLAEGGATTAAWTLDENLAREVISSVIATGFVQRASIWDDSGENLASALQEDRERGTLASWLGRIFASRLPDGERRLTVEDRGSSVEVGTLQVELSSHHVVDGVLRLAMSTVLATLISAFLIGLVLLWISARFVTSPLRRAAATIAHIDPEQPDQMRVPVPAFHRTNELGHLLAHTNEMLSRLARSQDQLRSLATRDPLTGLANRSRIQEHLSNALSNAARGGHHVAVLFLDLDRFKNVNDSLGHEAGDTLLIAVANALQHTMRSNDAVGRLGGDEFLIVLEQITHIDEVITAVRRLADATCKPLQLGAHEVQVAGSFGIAIFPDDGENASTLMRQADLAMYTAKTTAGTCWHFFSKELGEKIEIRLEVENALAKAIQRDELSLVYQPIYQASTGELAGCEALLRWNHGEYANSASEFIAIAEETGLIGEIGDWAFAQACRQIAQWGEQAVPIAVNVSARQLGDGKFVDRLLETIERFGIEPRLLEIELTETVLMRDLDHNENLLGRILDAGVAISIDDFGTGYSSLAYLTRLPISNLKIDRSFVSGERRSNVILGTIVAMAQTLGINTTAEGVETVEQREALTAQGCDFLQGFFLGRPCTAAQFETLFLTSRDHRRSKLL